MRYIIIFTNLAKFQAKLVYDHIAEKDSPAENCIAICTSKNINITYNDSYTLFLHFDHCLKCMNLRQDVANIAIAFISTKNLGFRNEVLYYNWQSLTTHALTVTAWFLWIYIQH